MTYETTIGSGFVVRTRGRPFKRNTGAGQSHEWPPNPPITTLSLSHENSPIAMHTYIFWDFNKNGCGPFCHCMQLDAFFQLLIYNVNCAGFSLVVFNLTGATQTMFLRFSLLVAGPTQTMLLLCLIGRSESILSPSFVLSLFYFLILFYFIFFER